MTVNTILVPTDFSPSAKSALEYATMLARGCGASLLIVYVLPVPEIPGPEDDVFDPKETSLHKELQAVRPSDSRVLYEHCFGHGIPSRAIVHLAEHNKVDLIVMGAHGETGLKNEPMGAVARHVTMESPCPVLTFISPSEKVP